MSLRAEAVPQYLPAKDKYCAHLPSEILLQIFEVVVDSSSTGLATLGNCARVCRHWNRVAMDPVLWRKLDLRYLSSRKKM